MNKSDNQDKIDGYIVEYVVIGNSVKVNAFDPVSLTEVSVIGIRGLPEKTLARLAIKKLEYVIGKTKK